MDSTFLQPSLTNSRRLTWHSTSSTMLAWWQTGSMRTVRQQHLRSSLHTARTSDSTLPFPIRTRTGPVSPGEPQSQAPMQRPSAPASRQQTTLSGTPTMTATSCTRTTHRQTRRQPMLFFLETLRHMILQLSLPQKEPVPHSTQWQTMWLRRSPTTLVNPLNPSGQQPQSEGMTRAS